MKRRVALWALIGLAVASAWVIVGVTWPHYNLGRWTITAITAPSVLLGRMMPLSYHWFILLNGIFYALVGLATEFVRHGLSEGPAEFGRIPR
jgi:hypothetical protein